MTYKVDKIAGYAAALDTDISAIRYPLVVKRKVVYYFCGTVYGAMVMTDRGSSFDTFDEARENACLFVSECRRILNERLAPPAAQPAA